MFLTYHPAAGDPSEPESDPEYDGAHTSPHTLVYKIHAKSSKNKYTDANTNLHKRCNPPLPLPCLLNMVLISRSMIVDSNMVFISKSMIVDSNMVFISKSMIVDSNMVFISKSMIVDANLDMQSLSTLMQPQSSQLSTVFQCHRCLLFTSFFLLALCAASASASDLSPWRPVILLVYI
jgi:hypothetical protein